MDNLLKMKNLSIENIIERLDPVSKYENAIYYCCSWLLDCGNYATEFKSITDSLITFEDPNSGRTYVILYNWNSEKWKWEFRENVR